MQIVDNLTDDVPSVSHVYGKLGDVQRSNAVEWTARAVWDNKEYYGLRKVVCNNKIWSQALVRDITGNGLCWINLQCLGNVMCSWEVYLNGRLIDTVYFAVDMDADYVKMSLVDHDGYDPNIVVERV